MKEDTIVLIPVRCSHCHSDHIIKGGTTKAGIQRYKCLNATCPHYAFQRDLIYKGHCPEIKEHIVAMALNGSGIRDTIRVLKISPTTVLNELKRKESTLSNVNRHLLAVLKPDEVTVVIRLAEEAEVDEMWSFVGKKREPRWLWHAIDHHSGHVLAYVLGRRKDEVFLKLKALLEPFGITRYYTDYWGPTRVISRQMSTNRASATRSRSSGST
jgi:IS1 family transposase/transposase-like protein